MAEWKANGGQEALDNQAKEAKAAKREQKKAAKGGASGGAASKSKPKSKSSAAASSSTVSPVKGGTGGSFKSKEFIEDSDSSDGKGSFSTYKNLSLVLTRVLCVCRGPFNRKFQLILMFIFFSFRLGQEVEIEVVKVCSVKEEIRI